MDESRSSAVAVSPLGGAPVSAAFWRAFFALCVLALAPIWVGEYLPFVDLPQHAAQLAIGERWHDPSFRYHDYFSVNWYTNQLFAYNVTRVFGLVLPVIYAIKCTLSLSLIMFGWSVYGLTRAVRTDPWFSLIAFPLGFSFSMYWGFFNFVTSLPIGIALISLCLRYALSPSRWRAIAIFLLANVLFFAHVLILAFAGLVSAALIAARARGLREKIWGLSALASVLPTVYVWWTVIQGNAASTTETPVRLVYGLFRLRELFNFQIGADPDDWLGAAVGLVLWSLPFWLGARFTRESYRYLPVAVSLALFFLLPQSAIEVDLIYPRFAVFVLPMLLIALEETSATGAARLAVAGALCAQLGSVAVRFALFDREARTLNQVLAKAEPNKRMLYLPTNPGSRFVPNDPYYHFGSWYQVKHGGLVDFSFAEFFPMWYRYRPEFVPALPAEFDSHSDNFNWSEHDGHLYDYLLVRGPTFRTWFRGADVKPVVLARAAEWTLIAPQRVSLSQVGEHGERDGSH